MILAAVSGGPDSIALCHWLESCRLPFMIAHVNYHHRPSAGRDEAIVRKWASDHRKELVILHCPDLKGNFQDAARKARYAFFIRIARMVQADTIALGHQQDDAIETWIMQRERGGLPAHYGLQIWTDFEGLKLFRPLLPYSKAQIQSGLDQAGIVYGIDESNLGNDYRRNQIRHTRLQTASPQDRKAWIRQMKADEEALQKSIAKARTGARLLRESRLPFEALLAEDGWRIPDAFFFEQDGLHHSKREMLDLIDQLSSGRCIVRKQAAFQVVDSLVCWRSVQKFSIPFFVGEKAVLEAMCGHDFSWNGVRFGRSGKTIESFLAREEDFPLLIRPWQPCDRILLRTGTKKISRLLIDRKIPALFRDEILVIESAKGILFAQHAGCDRFHYVESSAYYSAYYMVELPA